MKIIVKFVETDKRKIVNYVAGKHKRKAFKFLFFSPEKLEQKSALLIVGYRYINDHKDLFYDAYYLGLKKFLKNLPKPDGAGICENGEISDWQSIGFDILTPEKFRPIIEKALDMT